MHWVSMRVERKRIFSGFQVGLRDIFLGRKTDERERILWAEGGALSGVFWLEIFLEGISFSGRVS